MAYVTANGVKLWVEEAGDGPPLVFLHEFGGDVRVWRNQIAHFRNAYRCVAYNSRGYPPSDVPESEDAYGQDIAFADLLGLLDALAIDAAHLVGLSMGAYTALRFALLHPKRVLSVVAASGGSGSYKPTREHFLQETRAVADTFLASDSLANAVLYDGPTRIQLKRKNSEAWQEYAGNFAGFSPKGAGYTLRRVQAGRPSLYDFEAELRAATAPTLLMVGDEDELVIETNVFLKRTMPLAGLLMLPKTGHLLNLEEPDAFNAAIADFHAAIAAGNWPARDPASQAASAFLPEDGS